ncbi:hypothetical protein ACS0TY_006377 [Phlomoides rotata]
MPNRTFAQAITTRVAKWLSSFEGRDKVDVDDLKKTEIKRDRRSSPIVRKGRVLCLLTTLHHVWRVRNDCIFDAKRYTIEEITQRIKIDVCRFLHKLDPNDVLCWKNLLACFAVQKLLLISEILRLQVAEDDLFLRICTPVVIEEAWDQANMFGPFLMLCLWVTFGPLYLDSVLPACLGFGMLVVVTFPRDPINLCATQLPDKNTQYRVPGQFNIADMTLDGILKDIFKVRGADTNGDNVELKDDEDLKKLIQSHLEYNLQDISIDVAWNLKDKSYLD